MSKDPLNIALHFLKYRARSVFEIRQKLKQKSVSEEEIEKTIGVLTRNELLDDVKFANMYVRDRNRFKPTGSFLLKMELKKLGIDQDLIENVLAGQDEEELARRALESKSRFIEAEFEKKAQFLARRGFGMGVIVKTIKNSE